MAKSPADLPRNVLEYLNACVKLTDEKVYRLLTYLGEQCVNRVRDRSGEESWNDQTGNLRSSIGYMITRDGKIATKGGFKSTKAPKGDGSKGQTVGEKYATTISSENSSRMALVVVAGMEYAIYVEARDNKDVLASTQLWAQQKANEMFKRLQRELETEFEKLAKEFGLE